MKTSIYLKTLILFLCVTSIGCSTDSTDNEEEVILDYGTMQAKVSGLNTIPDNAVLELNPRARVIENTLWLSGASTGINPFLLYIQIPLSIKNPGVYTESIGGSILEGWSCNPNIVGGENCWYQYLHNFHSLHNDVTLKLTQLNEERIVGTFKVIGAGMFEQVNVTDVQFNILR